jgi:peptide deformylase
MIQLTDDLDILCQPCQQLHNAKMIEEQLPIIREAIAWVADPKNKCLGLAAPQIGHPFTWFVMKNPTTGGGWFDNALGKLFAVVNPTDIEYLEGSEEKEEGCLSFPGNVLKVARPRKVKMTFLVAYANSTILKKVTATFEGKSAQIAAHELAHLRGKSPHCHARAALEAKKVTEMPAATEG